MFLVGAGAGFADPAGQAAPSCIRTEQVKSTRTPDDRKIIFYMKNGAVYESDLGGSCTGLSIGGFSYVDQQTGTVCGRQAIRLTFNKSICTLGPFTLAPPDAK